MMDQRWLRTLRPMKTAKFQEVVMGHGLIDSREQNPLDVVMVEILEALYQEGVHKSSNRKGVLEMEETCGRHLPRLLIPEVHEISSWLSNQIAQDADGRGKSSSDKTVRKTEFDRRQDDAAVLSNQMKKLMNDESDVTRQTFKKQYCNIVLEVPADADDPDSESEIHIVTSVLFARDERRPTNGLACANRPCL